MKLTPPNITPGPWRTDSRLNAVSTLSGAGKHLATFHRDGQTTAQIHPSTGEAEGNARAIAALPDTLAALAGCFDKLDEHRTTGSMTGWDAAFKNARAALIKAGYTIEE